MENKEIKEAVASLAKDKARRQELSEMLVEWVQPGHIVQDVIGMILNTRSLNPGDQLVKKVRKGIRVYSFVPGSIPMKSEITVSERMNYILDTAQVSVTANEFELQNGEIGSVQEIKSEMAAKFKDYLVAKLFTSLSTVWTAGNTPDNFTNVGGSITKSALENAIKQINQTTSGAKAIVGTRVALTPILDFAGWNTYSGTNDLLSVVGEEIFRTGWLGQYKGVPLVVVDQVRDYPDDYNKMIPEDKILVVGENAGEFVTFGAPRSQEYTDMRIVPPQWNTTLWQQFGFIIDNAQGLYVLKVA